MPYTVKLTAARVENGKENTIGVHLNEHFISSHRTKSY
jgi:hypothetical protein